MKSSQPSQNVLQSFDLGVRLLKINHSIFSFIRECYYRGPGMVFNHEVCKALMTAFRQEAQSLYTFSV